MQVTKISAYSLSAVLKQRARGINAAGYTVKPGYSNGLFIYARDLPRGAYVGFGQRVK